MGKRPIRMRRRDIAPVEAPKPPAVQEDVVRLEKLLAEQPPADLTPVEAQLRTLRDEVAQLRKQLAQLPAEKREAANYRFTIHRGEDKLMTHVDAIVRDGPLTLLEHTKLH